MAEVQYVEASRIYPGNPPVKAVKNLNLDVADGEFLVLVGPSGCGKSTALRMLAGLEDVDEGEIRISGKDVSHRPPKERDIAMVFQNYALYPHMSVADNMGFALKMQGVSKEDRAKRVQEAAKLRVQTRTQIAELQQRLGVTTVYVTHDQVEAMTMGDRVAVLKDGLLQQVDSPRNMYERPNNMFVAGFIGSPAMNLFQLPVTNDRGLRLGGHDVPIERSMMSTLSGGTVALGVRPEDLHVVGSGEGIAATVEL